MAHLAVTPGSTDESIGRARGNPYGTAHGSAGGPAGRDVVAAARSQGRRLTAIAELIAGRDRAERVAA
jgi:NAD(P)H dehydrogenase (quinone)